MITIPKSVLWIVLFLVGGVSVSLAAPKLQVGDPAPPLRTGKWIQGEPVTSFEKGKTYIVEFWATWCTPCRALIPHLNEIYLHYKDRGLVVIGQDVPEDDETLVASFVKKMGTNMTYRIALDDRQGEGKGRMIESWYEPSGLYAIPSAMIVNKQGILAWIGNASEITNQLVEAVMSDKFDIQRSKIEWLKMIAESENDRKFNKALDAKDWQSVKAMIAEYVKTGDKTQVAWAKVSLFMAQRDYRAANAVVEEQYPLTKGGKYTEDAVRLSNSIAWAIANDKVASPEDFAFGEKLAQQNIGTVEALQGDAFETLARIQFRLGKHDEAVRTLEKALKVVPNEEHPLLQKELDAYKKGELPKI